MADTPAKKAKRLAMERQSGQIMRSSKFLRDQGFAGKANLYKKRAVKLVKDSEKYR